MRKSTYKEIIARISALVMALVMAAAFSVTDVTQVFGSDIQARAVSTASTVKAGSNTVKLTGCVKGKEYVLSVVKGSYKSYSVTDSSLLYIDQKTAQGSSLTFTFPIKGTARVVVLVSSNDGAAKYPVMIGEANIPISEAAITVTNRIYNGKAQLAGVSSIKYRGKKLVSGTAYTLSGKGTKVGTYTAKITGKGCFTGSVTKKFKINPVGTTLKSLAKGKKKMTVKWNKPAAKYKSQTAGYQIQYSLYSSFKKAKTVKVGKYATTKKVIKGLKAKKKYYVRIRVYKGSYYSAWSKAKTVVTK